MSVLAIASAYVSVLVGGESPPWAPWGLGLGTALLCASLTALGARRRDRSARAFAIPVLLIGGVVAAGFGAALLLPSVDATSPLVLGLPLRAAIVVYGIGVLPALVLPLFYARTFDALVLSDEDLDRVRRDARRAREAERA